MVISNMAAFDAYLSGKLSDYEYPERKGQRSPRLRYPKIPLNWPYQSERGFRKPLSFLNETFYLFIFISWDMRYNLICTHE